MKAAYTYWASLSLHGCLADCTKAEISSGSSAKTFSPSSSLSSALPLQGDLSAAKCAVKTDYRILDVIDTFWKKKKNLLFFKNILVMFYLKNPKPIFSHLQQKIGPWHSSCFLMSSRDLFWPGLIFIKAVNQVSKRLPGKPSSNTFSSRTED